MMTELVTLGPQSGTAAQLPVAITTLQPSLCIRGPLTTEISAGPEVSALLHYVPDLHRKMLLVILWNTVARINEALVLTTVKVHSFVTHQT